MMVVVVVVVVRADMTDGQMNSHWYLNINIADVMAVT